MPDLDRNIHFSGDDDVNADDLGSAEVANSTTTVDATLQANFHWAGKAIGTISLTLSHDNSRVTNSVFVTWGETELEEYRTSCDQIWPDGPDHIFLAMPVNSLNPFTFSGGLWSNLLPSQKIKHGFYNRDANNAPIEGEQADLGTGEFCLPAFKHARHHMQVCSALLPGLSRRTQEVPRKQPHEFSRPESRRRPFPLGTSPVSQMASPIVPLIKPDTPFIENDRKRK
jgi:hypothetical protein